MRNVKCLTPAQFVKQSEGLVNFGFAPDGLPWVTDVVAPPSGAELLQTADRMFCLSGASPDFAGTPLHDVVRTLDELIRSQYSQQIELPSGKAFLGTILPKPLRSLIGDTILERLFSSNSSSTVRSCTTHHTGVQAATNAAALEYPGHFPFKQGDACLAFPDDDQNMSVVYMTHDTSGWPSFQYRGPFLLENLETFADARFLFQVNGRPVIEMPCQKGEEYLEKRNRYDAGLWQFSVSRLSMADKLLDIAKAVSDLQHAGEIHADIKPSNILVTTDGVRLIDSLQLESGSRSPAMTRGWAAPEQVMASKVGPGTDQFAIGLMLLTLAGGVLFGEETTMVVPSGGTGTARHTIFRSPMVFIDPESGFVPGEHVRAWGRLIERCLCFSPRDRFPSAADLVGELEDLLESESLSGTCDFPLYFGQAGSIEIGDEGHMPCWIVG